MAALPPNPPAPSSSPLEAEGGAKMLGNTPPLPKRFFEGFNELRALAALAVLAYHAEIYQYLLGMRPGYEAVGMHLVWVNVGRSGVHLFFTLSGFLITYLLCAERQNQGTIHFRHFYFRRVLRIWPLYYWVLGLSVAVLPVATHIWPAFFNQVPFLAEGVFWPTKHGLKVLGFFTFIAPNIAINIPNGNITGANQGWSIGVEEQFYLLWPFLLMLPRRWFVGALVVLAALCISFEYWADLLFNQMGFHPFARKAVGAVLYFQYMCFGAGAALLVFYRHAAFARLSQWHYLPWLLVPCLLIGMVSSQAQAATGVGFALLVAMLAMRPGMFRVKWFAHLGGISYGLYMYHSLVMYVVLGALLSVKGMSSFSFGLWFYVLTLGLTYGVAWLSYHYLEARFLRLKHKFE